MTSTTDKDTGSEEQSAAADVNARASWSKALAAVVLVGIAIFYFVSAMLLPSSETDEVVGPKVFPVVVSVVLLCTTALGIVSMIRGRADVRAVSARELIRVLICVVLFGLFTASIFLIGFAEAAAVFSVLVIMLVFGIRLAPLRAVFVLLIGLVIGLVLFLIFDVWLNVLLPVGWIEFLLFGGLGL